MSLSICHVIASINRDFGGPSVSVPALASALAAEGVVSSLATLDHPERGPQTAAPGVRLLSVPADGTARRFGRWSSALRAELCRLAAECDVIHNHGLWLFPNLYARQAALGAGRPLVISPRGMVESWSLGRSRLRKFLAWHAFEKANLGAARMFHATSASEAASLRALGFHAPVAVVPNGIEIPATGAIPGRGILESRFPELAGRRWLLFMSRLHPKKGVAELLRAWSGLAAAFPDWHLVVAGPDLDGYGGRARTEAGGLRLDTRVTFTGMLSGAEKHSALGNAALFVLPTHSENFGIAIAEALAHGVPVITTKGAPWSELVSERCGWWIEPSEPALGATLQSALTVPPPVLQEMGARGRRLMEEKYSWSGAARQMLAAYQWLLGRGSRPSCVMTE